MRAGRPTVSSACAALAFLLAGAGPAPSAEWPGLPPGPRADPGDLQALDGCFVPAASAAERRACIGRVSTPCRDTPDGRTTTGIRACLERELLAWRELRSRYVDRFLEGADDRRKGFLASIEAVWWYRTDVYCQWPNHLLSRGTIAAPLILECRMTSTALETVDLAEMAEWLH